jgi:hypothetical protein
MFIQAHDGSHARRMGSQGTLNRRTIAILAAVVIETAVVLTFVGVSLGLGVEGRVGTSGGHSTPFATPAPEAVLFVAPDAGSMPSVVSGPQAAPAPTRH